MQGKMEKSLFAAGGLLAVAATLWLAPVVYKANGTVASADEQVSQQAAPEAAVKDESCASAVWPNIPAECLKGEAGSSRVIVVPVSKQG